MWQVACLAVLVLVGALATVPLVVIPVATRWLVVVGKAKQCGMGRA